MDRTKWATRSLLLLRNSNFVRTIEKCMIFLIYKDKWTGIRQPVVTGLKGLRGGNREKYDSWLQWSYLEICVHRWYTMRGCEISVHSFFYAPEAFWKTDFSTKGMYSRLASPQKEAFYGCLIRRKISQTINAESECWDHPFLKNV